MKNDSDNLNAENTRLFNGNIFNLDENLVFSIIKMINKFRNTLASGKLKSMPDVAGKMRIMVNFI